MNKKIEKPNYTQTPNILFDEIMRDLNGAELKVILAVIRKTFGWHKERDRISLTQLEEMTGLSRQGILNAIHGKKKEKSVIGGLVNKGYIKIIETKQGNVYELVVKEVDQQETASQLSRLEVVNKVDQESGLASQQSRLTKESILNKLDKETITQQPLIPSLSSKLITKETSNNNDSPFQTKETNKAIETTRVSSKTKETNKKKEKANALPTANESFYKNIESIYFENYKSLFEKGKLQIEVPAYSYAKNRSILSRYKNYDESLLKKVLDNAMDDKWIVDNGYGFNQIFSENVFNRLVNVKSKDDLIPVQNNCAKCGFPLQNNKCLFCG
jgi:phage replication O-like protein O